MSDSIYKIGVIGLNGSGKSTLLKIMAGLDEDFIGEAAPDPSIKVGYLAQEPELDSTKDVKILVGGMAFVNAPDLAERYGADGYATDAADALKLGNQLVGL